MPTSVFVSEFEQLVLLHLLHLGREGFAIELRERLARTAGRPVSRGALYRTLDRLEGKGWVAWEVDEEEIPERGGHPRRRFRVTEEGVVALRASREALLDLWDGLEEVLG
jgi:DNA-binding PadR family transcriptional regulator